MCSFICVGMCKNSIVLSAQNLHTTSYIYCMLCRLVVGVVFFLVCRDQLVIMATLVSAVTLVQL